MSAAVLLIFILCIYILIFAAIESIWKDTLSAVAAVLISMPFDGVLAIPTALLGYSAIHHYALAKRGEASGIVTVSGQCSRLIGNAPFRTFAQIGDASATARWYCLPIEWDYALRADAVSLVMDAVPATGYAARLISIGFQHVDLPAREATRNGPFETFALFPTPEIKTYLSRVRSHAWSIEPQSALRAGITSFLYGAALMGFGAVIGYQVAPVLHHGFDPHELGIVAAFIVFPRHGGLMSVRGIRYILAARRGVRFADEPGLAVEGTVTSTCARRDGFTTGRLSSVYIELLVDDDTTLIFRVPGKLAHRVLIGNRVRVECNPATEVVTNVTLLAPEEIAV